MHFACEEVDRLKCVYLQKQVAFNTSGRPIMKARSAADAEAYIQFLKDEIGKQVEIFSNKKLLMEGRLKGIERESGKINARSRYSAYPSRSWISKKTQGQQKIYKTVV